MSAVPEPLIQIRDLSVGFTSRAGKVMPVLRNIELSVSEGETIGLVGESGSGKSTLALAMMGYLKRGLHVLAASRCSEAGIPSRWTTVSWKRSAGASLG